MQGGPGGSLPTDPASEWRLFVLEEYRALRQEVVTSLGSQQQILAFGTATVALILGPSLGLRRAEEVALVMVLGLLVPVVSALVVVIWYGEVLRMVRAGDALAEIETKLNEAGIAAGWPGPAFTWERTLRDEGQQFKRFVINYRGVVGAFGVLAVASVALAFVFDLRDDDLRLLTPVLVAISVLIGLVTGYFMRRRWRDESALWHGRRETLGRTG